MKKILLIFAIVISVNAEDFSFSGFYLPEIRKEIPKKNYGYVGGCIYNGKSSNGKLIKVYTKEACPTIEVQCVGVIPSIRSREIDIFEISNGECKIK